MTQNDCQYLIARWKEIKENIYSKRDLSTSLLEEKDKIGAEVKEKCWNMLSVSEKFELDREKRRKER